MTHLLKKIRALVDAEIKEESQKKNKTILEVKREFGLKPLDLKLEEALKYISQNLPLDQQKELFGNITAWSVALELGLREIVPSALQT